jgi:hypothetical protein
LGLMPAKEAGIVWYGMLILLSVGALWLLAETWQLSWKVVVLAAAGMAVAGPFVESVTSGQAVPLMLFGLSLLIWSASRERPRIAGMAMALFVLKLQLLLPIIAFLIGCRRYAHACWFGITAGALVILSLLFPGLASYRSYYELITGPFFGNPQIMRPELNPTFRGQMLRVFELGSIQQEWIFDFSAAIMVIALVGFFAVGRHVAKSRDWLMRGLLIVLPVGFITAFHVQNYDLLILVPLFVYLVQRWTSIPPVVQAATIVTGVVLYNPVYKALAHGYFGHPEAVVNLLFIMLLVLSAGLGLFAWKPRRWP